MNYIATAPGGEITASCNSTKSSRPPEIASEIETLDKHLAELNEHLGRLVAKIQPVVRSEPDSPCKDQKDTPPLTTDLGKKLRDFNTRLSMSNGGLNHLIYCIEL